ncbi:MAG: zinc-ribbon domain-containing protein, partial [Clostridia bacterium]|nr:zinc-ribbon domain-containing protein [Clostridia bacterium]
ASEWHSTENGVLTPKDVTAGSDKIVWWLCKNCGHEWKTHVCNRKAGKGCPQCA